MEMFVLVVLLDQQWQRFSSTYFLVSEGLLNYLRLNTSTRKLFNIGATCGIQLLSTYIEHSVDLYHFLLLIILSNYHFSGGFFSNLSQ